MIEADEDVLLYEIGHIPGAVKLDWHVDVQNPVTRDFIDQHGFEKLMWKLAQYFPPGLEEKQDAEHR